MRISLLTCLAMLAFASNSVLCRLALKDAHIDPLAFTMLRLASGALILSILAWCRSTAIRRAGSWPGAVALFLYAITFSLAYVGMDAGAGALLLFGVVQLTMLLYGIAKGERLTSLAMLGLLISIVGLVYLLLPGSTAPPLGSAALMIIAGIAWGAYSLLGKSEGGPLATTAGNFARALPLSLLCAAPFATTLQWDGRGVLYAVLSGAVASGLGYAVWYSVMKHLPVLKASTVQLTVPVLSVLAGVALLDEALTPRIVLACAAVLGGIAVVLASKQRLRG
ncbi:MAG TPA: DMT family transporter [Burkholderiaceae bacterium]|nr:DMT family transporter [Burkholderiaceae bacterium]